VTDTREHKFAIGDRVMFTHESSNGKIGVITEVHVSGEHVASFSDIRTRDWPGEVFLQDSLQAVERRAVVKAAAGLDVEKGRVSPGRILQPVTCLVAVGIEEEVAEALHGATRLIPP
jgi:hypothetical protein